MKTDSHTSHCRWVLSPKAKLSAEKLMISRSFLREIEMLEWKVNAGVQMCDIIAVGSFGVVATGFLIDNHSSPKQVCVKRSLNLQAGIQIAKAFYLELVLMKKCQHPNVVRLLDSKFDRRAASLTFVMPKADCDLQQYLKQGHSRRACFELFRDILYGIHYLHAAGVVHRDLAPSNIFVFYQSDGTCKASIGDLGMACFANSPEQNHQMFTTFPYRSPELFCRQGTTSPAIDVWSAGCILAEMIQQKSLFYYPKENFTCADEWWVFGRQCCALIPEADMDLNKQTWIRTSKGERLLNEVKSRYVAHKRLLWALPHEYHGPEDVLRQILTVDPFKRPTIEETIQLLDLERPNLLHIPNFSEQKALVQKELDLYDIQRLLETETSRT